MLLSKDVTLKWNSKIKKHYVDLGYRYTKMSDEFIVNVNDLTNSSAAMVKIKCDYCNDTIFFKPWRRYYTENIKGTIHKDACDKCKTKKAIESNKIVYGCENVFQLDEVKNKMKETNLKKYGCDNPAKSESVKEKIKQTNNRKYGCKSIMQTDEMKKYFRTLWMNKYGQPYSPSLNITHQKGELSPCWKGGALRNGLFRSTYQYKDWHDSVLKRDNYVCQCCGIKNGLGKRIKFNVHHIFNFADNEDLRYEVDNGICLCDECHRKFHSLYGYRNTTKEQLNAFILDHGKKVC